MVFVSATEFIPTSELGGCGHMGAAKIQFLMSHLIMVDVKFLFK